MLTKIPGLEKMSREDLVRRFGILRANATYLTSIGQRESLEDMKEGAQIIALLGMTPHEIVEADYAQVFGHDDVHKMG